MSRPPPKRDLLPLLLRTARRSSRATARNPPTLYPTLYPSPPTHFPADALADAVLSANPLLIFPDGVDSLIHSLFLVSCPEYDDDDDQLAPLRIAIPNATYVVNSAMRLSRDDTYTLCHRYTADETWVLAGFNITSASDDSEVLSLLRRVADVHRRRDIRPLLFLRLLCCAVAHLTSRSIAYRDGRVFHVPDIGSGTIPVNIHLITSPTYYE